MARPMSREDAPLLEVRGDKLFWRGFYMTPAEANGVLAEIRAAGQRHAYYTAIAEELAKRFERAMRHAGYIKESEAA